MKPTLWSAIPAIENLHTAWSKKWQDPKYDVFHEALDTGLAKLEEYYEKTAESDAHIIAMCTFSSYQSNTSSKVEAQVFQETLVSRAR